MKHTLTEEQRFDLLEFSLLKGTSKIAEQVNNGVNSAAIEAERPKGKK